LKRFLVLIFVAVGLIILPFGYLCAEDIDVNYDSDTGVFRIPFGKHFEYSSIRVKRVVDGDTLQLDNGERVRLIGIDTPEVHQSDKLFRDSQRSGEDIRTIQEMGRRSSEFTRELVEGKSVRLEFDVEKHDKYNRLLAYVYLVDDGTFVNAEIITNGYASLMSIPPNIKYADKFQRLYQEARQERRGLWQ